MKICMPFFPNTRDNTHCYQACVRMALKKILPRREFSYKKLEKMFDKPRGKWSWPSAAIVNLQKMKIEARLIDDLDYRKFSRDGGEYLRSRYGEYVASRQIEMSDIESEMENAREMVRRGIWTKRKVGVGEIEKFMKSGWIVIAHVNSRVLRHRKGYWGHLVVITGHTKGYFYVHNPGIPPRPNQKISRHVFRKAFSNSVFLIRDVNRV